ncbi:threonine/homoserine/homoserine lactone efflux protein [Kribbella orskensis]|uniref:Threonine/homoserine/homoserine lactone efflux protein n=1 Tax=Kribbella orskensis TaxID=2512216 RepID=A0ABY2BR04_9ACTN|nr:MULTISPECIES: LysE family translocator [Kribbella]TCN37238.1 threonine/homoserine/homoserine lactone efflux protein [Kribbella sp. VKM Ac-2500]TCO27854.1 threonine/homoserine/homoserine lactone efflux protein [Kribbella orskensis]
MPSGHHLLAFAITSFVIIVVPGPSVLFIVGRALAVGRREAVLTMVGNTVGAAVMLVAVALGLGALIAASAIALTVVKLAGAVYLIYLGVHAFRTRKSLVAALQSEVKPGNARRALRQGFLVGVTNAKTAVFFAAVLPQFVDKNAAPASLQILLLGLIFIVIALCSDSLWALVAGTAREWFARSPRRLELVGGTGGLMIIGLGASIAFTGSKE